MRIRRVLFNLLAMAAAPAIALSATAATAQDGYPTKPITLVAPYGPGGASDLASRTMASVIPQYLDQPVLVVNRTGAGGVTGSAHVYNSDPDGYTVMLARIGSHSVSPAMKANMPYEYDNFTYLGLIEINPVICATSTEKPYESFEDLINAVKEKPGELSYSSAGVGTLLQIGAVMVLDEAGIENPVEDAIHIPFDGGGAAATAAATGQVDFVCTNSSALMSNIQGGKLRPLLVTTEERLDDVPDAPTVSELGHPELETLVGWSGIAGPPDLPQEVVDTWADALQKVKKDDSWNKLVTQLGSVPKVLPPDETLDFVKKQHSVFSDLVERFDMKIE